MQSAGFKLTCSRAGLTLVGFAIAITAAPASAQTQSQADVEPGEIIVYREVAPRNALIPGTGPAHTVAVAPDKSVFAPLESLGARIDDQTAANISSGSSISSGPGAPTLTTIESLINGQAMSSVNGGTERASGGGGLGGMIGNTVTGALEGALAALPGGRP